MKTAVRIQSKTIPGASFVLRFPSSELRARFNMEAAAPLAAISELQEQRHPITTRYREVLAKAFEDMKDDAEVLAAAKADMYSGISIAILIDRLTKAGKKLDFPAEDDAALQRINRQIEQIRQDQILPVAVKVMLKSCNLDMVDEDGTQIPATHENLIAFAHTAFIDEIAAEATRLSEMSAEQVANFELPTTSGAAVDGKTNPSTVPTVAETSSSTEETAANSQH